MREMEWLRALLDHCRQARLARLSLLVWPKFGAKSLKAATVGQVRVKREVLGRGSRREVKALWEKTISYWEVWETRVERREGEGGWSRIVNIIQQTLLEGRGKKEDR